jgi:hypothetical protein
LGSLKMKELPTNKFVCTNHRLSEIQYPNNFEVK